LKTAFSWSLTVQRHEPQRELSAWQRRIAKQG
jgi:hypothetical protein